MGVRLARGGGEIGTHGAGVYRESCKWISIKKQYLQIKSNNYEAKKNVILDSDVKSF